MRILVIENEKPIAELLKLVLQRVGYQVRTAASGEEGLCLYEKHAFDLVITDIILPDMNGHMIVDFIRSSCKPHMPIIGISGTPWLLENKEFAGVLPKPFDLQELFRSVRNIESPPPN